MSTIRLKLFVNVKKLYTYYYTNHTRISRTLSQKLLSLLLMLRKVVNKIVPHLRLVLVQLLTIECVVRDSERTTRLKHERNGAFRDSRFGRNLVAGCSELFIGDAVGDHCRIPVSIRALVARERTYCHIRKRHCRA